MELTELINYVHAIQVAGNVQRKDVSGIEYDSRAVKKNSVFVAIRGFKTDGHKFIIDAINNGAIAIVLEDDASIPTDLLVRADVTKILVKNSRIALAEISKGFYKNPSSKIKLIGITGTNGKTTTAYIIRNILKEAGYKSGLVGTIANYIDENKIEAKLTTPESNDLNKMFNEMIEQNCEYAVMEVSSHSLALYRTFGLNYRSAVFTNITSDHLDFHKTFDDYLESKKILFDSLSNNSFAIVNSDDENSANLLKNCSAKSVSYGTSMSANVNVSDINYDLSGTSFNLFTDGNQYKISTKLIGTFNAYNCAAAFTCTKALGIPLHTIVDGIKSAPQVPGRFEVIGEGDKKAVIDYSHTADSLEKAIKALRKIIDDDVQLITVFGCGGDRDKSKRPEMGKIASELSDSVVVTSDNPRTEDPSKIIDDIKQGITKNNSRIIENRFEAIKYAIQNSNSKAAILIAGKGHENYQEINGVRHHFSDQETAREFLSR